jgi:hypothetical protein
VCARNSQYYRLVYQRLGKAFLDDAFGADAMQDLFFRRVLRSSLTPQVVFSFMSGVGLGMVMTLAFVAAIGL